MANEKYLGADKAIKEALVENRGVKVASSKEIKIAELELKLELAKLSHSEISEIRKQIIKLRS